MSILHNFDCMTINLILIYINIFYWILLNSKLSFLYKAKYNKTNSIVKYSLEYCINDEFQTLFLMLLVTV